MCWSVCWSSHVLHGCLDLTVRPIIGQRAQHYISAILSMGSPTAGEWAPFPIFKVYHRPTGFRDLTGGGHKVTYSTCRDRCFFF
jgi:hypothetical protein